LTSGPGHYRSKSVMGCVWSSESVVLSVPLYFCFTQLKTCPILCSLTVQTLLL
ncbi:hypothetical protein T02_2147, partial [Trichinella nativa]